MNFTLYTTTRSPYARKVKLALIYKGIDFEESDVDLKNKGADFIAATPAATVPALRVSADLVLNDSTIILHYLEEVFPNPTLVPGNVIERYQMWGLEELADRLAEKAIKSYFLRLQEPKEAKASHLDEMKRLIAPFESLAQKSNGFLLGVPTYADLALLSSLDYMKFRLDMDWLQLWPGLASWSKIMSSLKGVNDTYPVA